MTSYDSWLETAVEQRHSAGLQRTLQPRDPSELLDLAGNDYLGLARDARVVAAAVEAVQVWGAGATGSRLVSGTTKLHADFETQLAEFANAEAALVFSSGYAANLGVLQALTDDNTLVVSDSGNHASLIDGCRLSRGVLRVVSHADPDAVEHELAQRTQPRAVVVTDAVFSVDGDLAPLAALHRICRAHDALLVVDEAHALGVVGAGGVGAVASVELAAEPDIVRTVTLSKALGSQGGAVLATNKVIDHLVNTARTFIFDTGLAPVCVGAAAAALRILRADPDLSARVRRRAGELAADIGTTPPDAAVVSVVIGDPSRAVAVAARCRDQGVAVGCFRPPSVPEGTSRLRLTARADLSDDDVARAVSVVVAAAKDVE
jgi:8-amino-7-oxononanoate synthase